MFNIYIATKSVIVYKHETRPNYRSISFFWIGRENRQMSPTVKRKTESWLLLTIKVQVHGISFERCSRPWQTVDPIPGPSSVLTPSWPLRWFLEVSPASRITPLLVRLHKHVWWADASRKRTSTVKARVNPRAPNGLESHFEPDRHGSTA